MVKMSPRQSATLSLEHILLAILDQKPMHGYELYQELGEIKGISLIWNIKQALLYAILDKLEETGLLSSQVVQDETHPRRKYFYMTEMGRNALLTWRKTPVRRARDIRQEFLAKLIVARRYGKSDALEIVRLQEQSCQTWLDELQTKVSPADQGHPDEWLVHSFRINWLEAILKWLKMCELEIDRIG